MLKRTELRLRPSGMMRSWRTIPSCTAPRRRIAARDFSLSSSVVNCTRTHSITSNAWVSSNSLASVLTPDFCTDWLINVWPISSLRLTRSTFQNRVLPTTSPVSRRTMTNGITVPASRPARAMSTYFSTVSGPGTLVTLRFHNCPSAAACTRAVACSRCRGRSSTVVPVRVISVMGGLRCLVVVSGQDCRLSPPQGKPFQNKPIWPPTRVPKSSFTNGRIASATGCSCRVT